MLVKPRLQKKRVQSLGDNMNAWDYDYADAILTWSRGLDDPKKRVPFKTFHAYWVYVRERGRRN